MTDAQREVERELTVGDMILDNDPRMEGRHLIVVRIIGDKARCRGRYIDREVNVRTDRIHLDDKPRRSGFTRIKA